MLKEIKKHFSVFDQYSLCCCIEPHWIFITLAIFNVFNSPISQRFPLYSEAHLQLYSSLKVRTCHVYKDSPCKASAQHTEKTALLWLMRRSWNLIFMVVSQAKTLSASTAAWVNAFNFESSHYRSSLIFFAVWDKYTCICFQKVQLVFENVWLQIK